MLYQVKSRTGLSIVLQLLAVGSLLAQPRTPEAKASKEVVKYLERIQLIIRKNALVTDSIDWQQLSNEVREKARGLVTIDECKPILDYIQTTLRSAGDKQSVFVSKKNVVPETVPIYAGQ